MVVFDVIFLGLFVDVETIDRKVFDCVVDVDDDDNDTWWRNGTKAKAGVANKETRKDLAILMSAD